MVCVSGIDLFKQIAIQRESCKEKLVYPSGSREHFLTASHLLMPLLEVL